MHSATLKPSILPVKFTLPEVVLPPVLPTGPAALTALLHTQQQAHDESHTKALDYINYLFEQMVLLRHRQFGSSSEQLSGQARLFDEAEVLATGTTEEQDIAPIPSVPVAAPGAGKPADKARGKRAPLPPELPRQTLARWVIGAAGLLQPLQNLMRDTLFDGPFMHMDETVVQVLKEKDKSPASNSYMWVGAGGPPDKPVVIYDYDPSRSAEVPARLLLGYQGDLMTDGYDGYNLLARTEGIERLVCWTHVRRRFVEAVRVQPKGKKGRADEAVALIGRLYGVEREHKNATDEARFLARQQLSVPVLAELRAWLTKMLPAVVPNSALGKALSYMHGYWSMLTRYTERGDLPIDNNRCENAIRPFVIGRKAWLFSDTPAGAHASAVIYSLLETAKANAVDPYAWLRRVMRDLPAAETVENIEALLPWNLHGMDLTSEMAQ